jgi:class 3 adenylate cyclase
MAKPSFTRRNEAVLPWTRAIAFAAVTFLAVSALRFYPAAGAPLLAFAVGTLGLLAPGIGILVFVIAVGIPLAAGDILAGVLFLLLGFSTIQYLSDSHGRAFLVISLGFGATLVHAEWAVAALAGYLMGASEGAIAAFVACLVIQGAGLLVNDATIGSVATGGTGADKNAIVDLARLAALRSPLTFGWVAPALGKLDPGAFIAKLSSLRDVVLFAAQPFLWACGAAVAGLLRQPPEDPRRPLRALLAVSAAVGVLAVASIGANVALGGPVGLGTLALTAGVSLAVALAAAAASEWAFTPVPVVHERAPGNSDEADVDELLRMISSAEEELASKHTVHKTVLITDMKAFSRMTQELGSAETARLVQRHRDLLLPIIEAAGGHGKSTGGDGLLAAFDTPKAALEASVEMQRALFDYNAKRPGEEAVLVRAGIASGEVVLDKGGKPFLGDALNRAARVMSLADGGQVFAANEDVDAAGVLPFGTAPHGSFRLKNIAEPVEIVEVLWRPDQEARPPYDKVDEE